VSGYGNVSLLRLVCCAVRLGWSAPSPPLYPNLLLRAIKAKLIIDDSRNVTGSSHEQLRRPTSTQRPKESRV